MSEWKETEFGIVPSDWGELTVNELVEQRIIEKPLDGNHGNIHPKGNDFIKEGIPFIMASDIKNGKVDLINCAFISEEQANNLQKGFSITNDVLLTHKASLGRTAIVGELKTPYIMLTPQVTYYRVIDYTKLNNIFLKYFFDSPSFQGILENHGNSGSTRAYVGITAQRELPVLMPKIEEQKSIASILSSLDDKIDLLHRQNATLEKMAETLFRQWFIEEAKEDWEMETLYHFADFFNGKARPNEQGTIPIYGGNGILGYTNKSNYSGKSIIIGRVGAYCGSLYYETKDIWVSDNALLVKAKIDNTTHFLFYLMKTLDLNSMAEGSSHPLLTQTLLKTIEIQKPPIQKIYEFDIILESMQNKIDSNKTQIRTLTALRDTLLPKLMSGEIKVNL